MSTEREMPNNEMSSREIFSAYVETAEGSVYRHSSRRFSYFPSTGIIRKRDEREEQLTPVENQFMDRGVTTINELVSGVKGYSKVAFNNHVGNLKSKVEDDTGNPKFIITVQGLGFVFVDHGVLREQIEKTKKQLVFYHHKYTHYRPEHRVALPDGTGVELTPVENGVLIELEEKLHLIVDYEVLEEIRYGITNRSSRNPVNAIKRIMDRLRTKLPPDCISSDRGEGYRLIDVDRLRDPNSVLSIFDIAA